MVKKHNRILKSEGDGAIRYAPCSTFKMALVMMGYDSGILVDEMHPVWPFQGYYEAFLECWKEEQTPTSWMKNSCVWYSQQ